MELSARHLSRKKFLNSLPSITKVDGYAAISISDTNDELDEVVSLFLDFSVNGIAVKFQDADTGSGVISEEQSDMIVKFIDESIKSGNKKIFVHCFLGVSRSAAVAKFIYEYYHGEDNPMQGYYAYNRAVYTNLVESYHRIFLNQTQSWR